MILIIDMNWKKDSLGFSEFVIPILAIAEKLDVCTVKHYLDVTEEDLKLCDKITLSGTALKDVATLDQPEKFHWLKETEKPVLGICAGMETIGVVYHARLEKCVEIGMTSIKTLSENPLVAGNFRAYSLHSYCVGSSDDFEVWAESGKCSQIIKHTKKRIYGILFHPEVRNQEIIKRFLEATFVLST
jgi:GMP synthase-like glutamine amidotransferase